MTGAEDHGAVDALLAEVHACSACTELPLGPRPILQMSSSATLLIASQAPGTRAHMSGKPFADASGDQLRRWLGLDSDVFYDPTKVAIVPMALCYPGRAKSGGDAPPPSQCSTLWRDRLISQLKSLKLTLLVGTYAQEHVLGAGRMVDRVRNFDQLLPTFFPLPHPSWRSNGWMKKNAWFEADVLPALRLAVSRTIDDPDRGD